ncbi:MAG: LLM class F420-dependent oxidoreductase [Porticoccaceae bacterium]
MRIGMTGCGFGPTARGDLVRSAAQAAENAGFSTFWFGEHAVLFEAEAESLYPDRDPSHKARSFLLDPQTAIADPIVAMTWAAAATQQMEIGSSVLILPQRQPVVLAKELATLDSFSGGRVVLGVGSGWSPQEYRATGADWPNRGRSMDEFVEVMRKLWDETPASHQAQHFSFDKAYLFPKPARDIPVIFGGDSDKALARVARSGDGWSPVKLELDQAPTLIARLRRMTEDAGRDPDALRIIKPMTLRDNPADMARFRDAGVTEFKLSCFGDLPANATDLVHAIENYAERFVTVAKTL